MDFNLDTGTIYNGIQTIDPTVLPPLGGVAGVLTIAGTGALVLPSGTTVQQPGTTQAGAVRFNTETSAIEVFDGSAWGASAGSGSVTSVDAAVTGTGLTVSGGPITSAGTLTFALSATLQGIGALPATSGIIVQTTPGVFASRTITGTTDQIVVVDGDGLLGNPTLSLAPIGTAIANQLVSITTDAFGRVTASTPVLAATLTPLLDPVYVNVTGDTMNAGADITFSGGGEVLGLPAVPSAADAAASKEYVDAVAQGLSYKDSVAVATLADILLTGLQTIDDYTTVIGDRVLVKSQTNNTENGIYVASDVAWTRSTDADDPAELVGAAVFVENGTIDGKSSWTQTTPAPIVVGSSPIVFTQISAAGNYSAGNGLTLSGTQFSLTVPVTPVNGGTGSTVIPLNGQILIGSAGVYVPAALTAGTGITITGAEGAVTIDNTGVLSFNTRTGAVTLTTADVTTALGYTPVNVAGDIMTGDLIVEGSITASGAVSDISIAGGAVDGDPVTITASGAGADVGIDLVTQGAGEVTINGAPIITTLPPLVEQIIAGTNITIDPVGGTGIVTISAGGGGVTSIVAGAGISVTPVTGIGDVTVANTGVTSVGLALPVDIFTVTPPVTTTGTLTGALVEQAPNTFFAGPSGGEIADIPAFRALSAADLPIELYAENVVIADPVVTATAPDSQAFGDGANATVPGGKVYANGSFGTPGSAQHGVYILRNVTTSEVATELFLDGAAQKLIFPINSVVAFEILVTSRRTDVVGGAAGYKFIGVINKDADPASTAFIGTPSKTIIGEVDTAWDASVSVDIVNGALSVTVVGEASKTIRWVATVTTTEVTN